MVKFSRELEAQLIPEWKEAFVNYRQLKKHIKKIKLSKQLHSCSSTMSSNGSGNHCNSKFGFSVLDPFRDLTVNLFSGSNKPPDQSDEEALYDMDLARSLEAEMKEFYDKLEEEIEKVDSFYKTKEIEFGERADQLNNQLQILTDLKQILHDHRRRHRHPPPPPSSLSPKSNDSIISTAALFSRTDSNTSFPESIPESTETTPQSDNSSPAVADEVLAVLERKGVEVIGLPKSKAKKAGKLRTTSVRINIPANTPTRTIASIASICEDIINGRSKDGSGGDYVTRKRIQSAEKIIRSAFVELYKGLGLLKTYSSLNMVAFGKILKKFDKVTNQQASDKYLMKMKRTHFMSSDKVIKLQDEVEALFTKHFASNDRKKAMKFLKLHQPNDSHIITFFLGLCTGTSVTLFMVYAILGHINGIFFSSSSSAFSYVETVYPVFSMFALLSLHIFLYGCNLSAWSKTRINHNFIFEFSPNTAMKNRDAFLLCTAIMTFVVTAMVAHVILQSTGFSLHHVEATPGLLLLFFIGVLICPFNVLYRSTRYCFLRIIRSVVFSPFYKVSLVDFFMADQLTSQIPLLRHMETTACYFMVGGFQAHPYETCSRSHSYKQLAYIISFLPYYWRAMQCIRRYVEEGYEQNHLVNAGKYISAMVAAAARFKYAVDDESMFWLVVVLITSLAATVYQLYWDFVKDWGLFNCSSKNRWLRDELVLKNKNIYYLSICLNFVLRLAWIETVLQLNLHQPQHRSIDFLLASLEIIRRGHWNFYRLENEHLNNVGKFRAVKAVPLPFREM